MTNLLIPAKHSQRILTNILYFLSFIFFVFLTQSINSERWPFLSSPNASLASLEATQTERSRLKQFAALQSSNISSTSYDPYSSKSFLAIENDSEDELKSDVDSIRLLGQIKTDRYAKQAKISDITGDSYRAMGKTAWLKPAGTLMAGGYKAHKVTKEG